MINPLTNNFHNYCHPHPPLLFPPSTLTLLSPDSTNQTHTYGFSGVVVVVVVVVVLVVVVVFIVRIAVLLLQSVPQRERLFRC